MHLGSKGGDQPWGRSPHVDMYGMCRSQSDHSSGSTVHVQVIYCVSAQPGFGFGFGFGSSWLGGYYDTCSASSLLPGGEMQNNQLRFVNRA